MKQETKERFMNLDFCYLTEEEKEIIISSLETLKEKGYSCSRIKHILNETKKALPRIVTLSGI